MKNTRCLIAAATLALVFAASSVFAQPHGKGPGGQSGSFQGVIHSLFANHDKVKRSVELTDTGYRATTISEDKEVAKYLKRHVAQMESRLENGMGIRHWDPAFAELREHYDDMTIKVNDVDKGVSVDVVGKTPEAIKVAQNHAKIISGFVEKGNAQMHASHSRALGDGESDSGGQTKQMKCENCGSAKGGAGCQEGGSCGQAGKPCCAGQGR